MLIDECELQGVVPMPSGVFKPYAGVSTAIIVFVKGGKRNVSGSTICRQTVIRWMINATG